MPPPRIIDFQLPLPWLITSALLVAGALLSFGWQAAGQSNKLDQLLQASIKQEKRMDDRDVRIDALRDTVYDARRESDMIKMRVTALERDAK